MYRALRIAAFAGVAFLLASPPGFAQRKPCEELKEEIAKKIEANGVKVYTLTIVPAGEVKESDQVVGSCDGGTQRIVYKRG
ncbi:MAG TPA: DUF1161 domain-containing protein [Terriglobia bacterium]|nr:DUF1161 domain-containing protein [Terriglobia bacterium]